LPAYSRLLKVCNFSASLPGKAAVQRCRTRLPDKAAGAMVQYAESMVKLENCSILINVSARRRGTTTTTTTTKQTKI
jgi:hypothetical protein